MVPQILNVNLTVNFYLLLQSLNIAPANLHNALRGPLWLCQYFLVLSPNLKYKSEIFFLNKCICKILKLLNMTKSCCNHLDIALFN